MTCQELQAELNTKAAELTVLQAEAVVLDAAHQVAAAAASAAAAALAAKVAQERGFDVVMTTETLDSDVPDANALKQQIRLRHVIYANPGVDLTQDVLGRLNRNYADQGKKPNVDRIGP